MVRQTCIHPAVRPAANHEPALTLNCSLLWAIVLITLVLTRGWTMDIQWTRMAGQWPVEASPVVIQSDNSTNQDIVILNRGGQLLLWAADGTTIGPGQDGLIAQLPEGRWTTAPTLIKSPSGAHFVVTSVEGLVLCLDRKFQTVWQHRLSGETVWGRGLPAMLKTAGGPAMVFTDGSGTATCLRMDGSLAWTNALAAGPSKAPGQVITPNATEDRVLIPAGSTLSCCDADGKIRWKRNLGGKEILTRPEVLSIGDEQMIVCGTGGGKLCVLNPKGKLLWECAVE